MAKAKLKAMTPDEYRAKLERLDMTQKEAGEFTGKALRSSQGYALGHYPVPPLIAKVLRTMVRLNLKPADFY